MVEKSGFWHWYASVNDDVRSQLVDRMWFGREGDRHAERQLDQWEARRDQQGTLAAPQAVVETRDLHVPEALEGIGARGSDDMNAENIRAVMEDFYGRGRAEAPKDAATADREREEAMRDFYARPDLEQGR